VAQLRATPGVEDQWRFAEADGWHLTLAFLGSVAPDRVEPLVGRVATVLDSHAPFVVHGGDLGGFPRGSRSRVLWYGINDDERSLAALARDIRAAAGLADDQAFHPHVTLARSRDRRGAPLPKASGEAPAAEMPISEVALFRSHLGPRPASYDALTRLRLRMSAFAGAGR
jgi:2'-5' RNA ligase